MCGYEQMICSVLKFRNVASINSSIVVLILPIKH